MMNENLVWYVGFGSNIYKRRFLCYIQGGTPEGSEKCYDGCRDTTAPREDKSTIIKNELYFAKKSANWENGGVGFVNHQPQNHVITYGRMYLITKEQLSDVAKQETNSTSHITIDFDIAIRTGNTIFKTPSWYGNLIYLGKDSGYPIFTLTNEENLSGFVKPSRKYLGTIINGIRETHRLKDKEIFDYLVDKRGVSANYTQVELENLIREFNH